MDKQKSIDLLCRGAADELQAVHQYMYWHFHLDDQGLIPLAQLFRQTAIDEMRHVEMLAERVLFLKGDIDMVPAGPIQQVQDPEEILKLAMGMEQGAVESYNQFAGECAANADSASKQMFEQLVGDEEGHFDVFEKQLDNVKRFGPSYLALQSFNSALGQPGGGTQGA